MKNNLNLLLAAIFMIGFLVFWDSVVMKRYRAPAPIQTGQTQSTAAKSAGDFSPGEIAALAATAAAPDKDNLTLLEIADAKVSFLSRGARVASWQVKERDHWIELVEPEAKRSVSPLQTFPELNFAGQKKSGSEAVFSATRADGLQIVKTLRLLATPPFHEITLTLKNSSAKDISVQTLLPWGNGLDKHVVDTAYNAKEEGAVLSETRAVAYGAQVKSWQPGMIFQRTVDLVAPGPYEWAGVDNNHFIAAFIAANKDIAHVKVVADRKFPPLLAIPIQAVLKPGDAVSNTYLIYAGPKNYTELKKLGHNLDQSVNFGMFGVISKALLVSLKFFKTITGNYGWAIILLTFCIQLLVFPLTRKNLQHSLRMKELQPQLKKIQAQFKEDPKRLQAETFNLYKRNGMKFMGMEGCFPMLLQLPVFFAFYSTLRVAYELRGAPWIFWVHDLGAHDPYYVLPIIMGAGMFLQQKVTAVAADPAQARMMMFMPIMFTFMFLKLPSGLVLYWCVNSITTIVIQKLLSAPKNQPLELAG